MITRENRRLIALIIAVLLGNPTAAIALPGFDFGIGNIGNLLHKCVAGENKDNAATLAEVQSNDRIQEDICNQLCAIAYQRQIPTPSQWNRYTIDQKTDWLDNLTQTQKLSLVEYMGTALFNETIEYPFIIPGNSARLSQFDTFVLLLQQLMSGEERYENLSNSLDKCLGSKSAVHIGLTLQEHAALLPASLNDHFSVQKLLASRPLINQRAATGKDPRQPVIIKPVITKTPSIPAAVVPPPPAPPVMATVAPRAIAPSTNATNAIPALPAIPQQELPAAQARPVVQEILTAPATTVTPEKLVPAQPVIHARPIIQELEVAQAPLVEQTRPVTQALPVVHARPVIQEIPAAQVQPVVQEILTAPAATVTPEKLVPAQPVIHARPVIQEIEVAEVQPIDQTPSPVPVAPVVVASAPLAATLAVPATTPAVGVADTPNPAGVTAQPDAPVAEPEAPARPHRNRFKERYARAAQEQPAPAAQGAAVHAATHPLALVGYALLAAAITGTLALLFKMFKTKKRKRTQQQDASSNRNSIRRDGGNEGFSLLRMLFS